MNQLQVLNIPHIFCRPDDELSSFVLLFKARRILEIRPRHSQTRRLLPFSILAIALFSAAQ